MSKEHWATDTINNIIYSVPTGVNNYRGKKKYYSTGSIQKSKHVEEGEFLFHEKPSRANRIALLNDVFQARMKNTNKPILIDKSLEGYLFSTGFLQLRPYGETYNPRLLYYYIQSKAFITQKDDLATGSTQEALTDTNAVNLEFPLPPLKEQKRIVEKLDTIVPKVKNVTARLEKIPAILKRFRQSVLEAACSGILTEDWREGKGLNEYGEEDLPNGWKWIEVRELMPKGGIFDGPFGSNLKTSDYRDNGIRVIRLENIGHLLFVSEKESFVSKEKYLTLIKHTVEEGDIIFSSFITDEIRACILPRLSVKAIAKADCFTIRPNEKTINKKYLLYNLVCKESFNQLTEHIHGVSRPRINTTQLKKLKIRLCSPIEQEEIVHRIGILFKLANSFETKYKKAMEKVEKIEQAVLAKAFQGELVEADPNDEPAEELLKKILAEKAKLNSKTRKRKREI